MLNQLAWCVVVSQDSPVVFPEEEIRLLICVKQNVAKGKSMFVLKIAVINV